MLNTQHLDLNHVVELEPNLVNKQSKWSLMRKSDIPGQDTGGVEDESRLVETRSTAKTGETNVTSGNEHSRDTF